MKNTLDIQLQKRSVYLVKNFQIISLILQVALTTLLLKTIAKVNIYVQSIGEQTTK